MDTAMALTMVTMLPAIALIAFASWRGDIISRGRRLEGTVTYSIEQWQLQAVAADATGQRQNAAVARTARFASR